RDSPVPTIRRTRGWNNGARRNLQRGAGWQCHPSSFCFRHNRESGLQEETALFRSGFGVSRPAMCYPPPRRESHRKLRPKLFRVDRPVLVSEHSQTRRCIDKCRCQKDTATEDALVTSRPSQAEEVAVVVRLCPTGSRRGGSTG